MRQIEEFVIKHISSINVSKTVDADSDAYITLKKHLYNYTEKVMKIDNCTTES